MTRNTKEVTVRDFGGGLNTADSDLNLTSKYSKVLKNLYRKLDGSLSLRYGTRFFVDLTGTVTGTIVTIKYFNSFLIAVTTTGQIAKISGAGVKTAIWNSTLAAALPGAPAGWSAITFSSMTTFGGKMVICNGVDKPLLLEIGGTPEITYLQDIPVATNAFTPVARYCTTVNRFVVMAGDPTAPATLSISNQDTSGTWLGDAAPNNALEIDLSKYVPTEDPIITSVSQYRGKLLIGFVDSVLVGTLGNFDAATGLIHEPTFDEIIEGFGVIAHRAVINLGNDVLMPDHIGVQSLVRTLFSGTINPTRASQFIDSAIQEAIQPLTTAEIEDEIFGVYNKRENQYMLFIPTGSTTTCYVYTTVPSLKIAAWSTFEDWNWSGGTRSSLGKIFFSEGSKIYSYGSFEDEIYGDKIDDTAIDDPTNGDAIAFDWETPWSDFDTRIKLKHTRYIQLDTKGTATFTVQMFTDNIYKDSDDAYVPYLSMGFVGGDSAGYGNADQPYGGGRRSADERAWAWTSRFKIAKLRITGSTTSSLQIISISLAYLQGSYQQ